MNTGDVSTIVLSQMSKAILRSVFWSSCYALNRPVYNIASAANGYAHISRICARECVASNERIMATTGADNSKCQSLSDMITITRCHSARYILANSMQTNQIGHGNISDHNVDTNNGAITFGISSLSADLKFAQILRIKAESIALALNVDAGVTKLNVVCMECPRPVQVQRQASFANCAFIGANDNLFTVTQESYSVQFSGCVANFQPSAFGAQLGLEIEADAEKIEQTALHSHEWCFMDFTLFKKPRKVICGVTFLNLAVILLSIIAG